MYNYLQKAIVKNSESCVHDTNSCYTQIWDEPANFHGWDDYKDVYGFGVWNGELFGFSLGGDCYISHTGLLSPIDADNYYILKLQMKLVPKNTTYVEVGKIMWIRDGDLVWNDDKSIEFEVYMDSKWRLYEINLGPKQWWQGNVRNLRIFPFRNSREGDSFFIRSIEIISPFKFSCTNHTCSWFNNYTHPCKGCGERSFCKSAPLDFKTLEITDTNNELIVNIDDYGDQVLKLDSGVFDRLGIIENINKQLSKVDIGGYVYSNVQFEVDCLTIFSGTYSESGSVKVGYSNLAVQLGFYDNTGNFIGSYGVGKNSASGFEFKASYRLRSVDIQNLLSEGNAGIYHDVSRYEVEAGRLDWNEEAIVFFNDKLNYHGSYDWITPEPFSGSGITVVDLTHPFNNEGRITKVYVSGSISDGNVAKFKVFRPYMDGTIELVYEKEFGHEVNGYVYTKRHDSYEIDVDFYVKKGDLVGFYNIELILGNVSTLYPDALYCKYNKDLSGRVKLLNVFNKGNAGLCYYVRGDRTLDLISLEVDFGDSVNVSNVVVDGVEEISYSEYNMSVCKDARWSVNLFGGTHNHIICPVTSIYCYFVTHNNIAYGIEALNDGKRFAYNGLAGTSWGRDSNGMWTSGTHSYFYVNGDGEWLAGDPGEIPPNSGSISEPMNFEYDPIELVISWVKPIPIFKTSVYFKERNNFQNFSWSYLAAEYGDVRNFVYLKYNKVKLDSVVFTKDVDDDLKEILFSNPTSLVWKGEVFGDRTVLADKNSNFASYALEWNVLEHEFDIVNTRALRLFTNYHKSTKICEIEVYTKIDNYPSLLDAIFLSYSREGDYWRFSTLEEKNGLIKAIINDTPRFLTIDIRSSNILRLDNIYIEFDDDVVKLTKLDCDDNLFLENNVRGSTSDIEQVSVINDFNVEANLKIDIPDNKIYTGTILDSKLSSLSDISNPTIGPGGTLFKNEDYIFKNMDKNIAINCNCYALNNLAHGSNIWLNYHPNDNYDLHLNGKSKAFPNDVRFTASDGVTELSYCITHIEDGVAYIWVKMEDNLDSDAFFYVYYGANVDETTGSGEDTFEFFDDFSGVTLDFSKWEYLTENINNNLPAHNSNLEDFNDGDSFSYRYGFNVGTSSGIETVSKFDIGKCCFVARIRTNTLATEWPVGLFNSFGTSYNGVLLEHRYGKSWRAPTSYGTVLVDEDYKWHIAQIFYNKFAKLDDHLVTSGFNLPSTLNNRLAIAGCTGEVGGNIFFSVDYAFVRKCIYPEPYILNIDSESIRNGTEPWLSGWRYRKKISVRGVSGAGTGYQILVRIRENDYSIWGLAQVYDQEIGFNNNFKAQLSMLNFFPVPASHFRLVPDSDTCFSNLVEVLPMAEGQEVSPLHIKAVEFDSFDSKVWDLSSVSFSSSESSFVFENGSLIFDLADEEVCDFEIVSKFLVGMFPDIRINFDVDNNAYQDSLEIGLAVVSEDGSIFKGLKKINTVSKQKYSYLDGDWNTQVSETEVEQNNGKLRINKRIEMHGGNTFRDYVRYYYYSGGWVNGYTSIFLDDTVKRFYVKLRINKQFGYPKVRIVFDNFVINDSVFYSSNSIVTNRLSDGVTIKSGTCSLSNVGDFKYNFSNLYTGWNVFGDKVLNSSSDFVETAFPTSGGEAGILSNWYLPNDCFEVNVDLNILNNLSPDSGKHRFFILISGLSKERGSFFQFEWSRKTGEDAKYEITVGSSDFDNWGNVEGLGSANFYKLRVSLFDNRFRCCIKRGSNVDYPQFEGIYIDDPVGFRISMGFEAGVKDPQVKFKVGVDFAHRGYTHQSTLEIALDSPKVLDSIGLIHYGLFNFSSVDLYISNDGVNYLFWQKLTKDDLCLEWPYSGVAVDLQKRYSLDFIRSYGSAPLLFFNESTVEFSNSEVSDAEDVVWGNSNKSDVRWFLINIDPNTSSYIRKIGVYPDISTAVASGGGKNCYWTYLGDMLTSFPIEENIAFGATVSGSTYFGAMYPEYVVDGVITDGFTTKVWGSDSNANQWLKIYLGSVYNISKINLYFGFGENESDFMIEDYKIYFSDDDVDYTEVTSVTGNSDYYRQHLYSNKRAKFVKLVISKYSAGKIEVEGGSSFEGAVIREIEIIRDTSTEQDYIDSEQYPVVAINSKDVFNINSIEFYKKDGWGNSYILWSKDSSNLRCSDFVADDPSNVEFSNYGVTFPNRFKWLSIKQNYAENCPSVGDTKRYLYKVKEFADGVFRITEYPWWWNSTNTLSREYLIKSEQSVSSIKVTAVSGTDQLSFIEGSNFGNDEYFSEMDFVAFDVFTVVSGLELRELIVGDYSGNRYHSWDLSSIRLETGWNTVKLKWKDADNKVTPINISNENLESRLQNNYRDLILKSFRLVYSCSEDLVFYLDDLRISRNLFDETINENTALYLSTSEYVEFPLAEFSPRVGTVEFYIKPDFNFNGVDDFFETFSRTFFAFSNVANDIFGFFVLRGIGPAIAVGNSKFIKVKYVKYDSDAYFNIGDVVHFSFVWSNNGTSIDSFGTTAQIYINNRLVARSLDTWEVRDNLTSRFILGGSISQKAAKEKPTSIWGSVYGLKIYNYCKFPTDGYEPISSDNLVEVSLDGINFYNKNSNELPIIIEKVQPGEIVTFYVRSDIPRFVSSRTLRTPSLLLEWIRSF